MKIERNAKIHSIGDIVCHVPYGRPKYVEQVQVVGFKGRNLICKYISKVTGKATGSTYEIAREELYELNRFEPAK